MSEIRQVEVPNMAPASLKTLLAVLCRDYSPTQFAV